MINHVGIDGKLLQTNKKFSQLKLNQKEWISNQARTLYLRKHDEVGKSLSKHQKDEVVWALIELIKQREIWIPGEEVFGYFSRNVARFEKAYLKSKHQQTKESDIVEAEQG